MKQLNRTSKIAVVLLVTLSTSLAGAQAVSTASRTLQLSAFGGATGVFTGLLNGRNLSITAGADLAFRSFYGIRPSIEVRGTYPVDSGSLINEKDALGGVRLSKSFHRFMPYADVLFGRGQIDYPNGFLSPDGTLEYLNNPTNVLSGGGGLDFDLTDHFSIKADAQYQRFNTPVVTSGHIYAKPLTLAVVYRFNFGHYPIR